MGGGQRGGATTSQKYRSIRNFGASHFLLKGLAFETRVPAIFASVTSGEQGGEGSQNCSGELGQLAGVVGCAAVGQTVSRLDKRLAKAASCGGIWLKVK